MSKTNPKTLDELMSYDLLAVLKDTVADATIADCDMTDEHVMCLLRLNMIRARDTTYKLWLEQCTNV